MSVDCALVSARDHGSCNFCDRGRITAGDGISYPYEAVLKVWNHGGGPSFRMCAKCLAEFRARTDSIAPPTYEEQTDG